MILSDRWVGAREAGRILGVHENTVRAWAAKGWLTPIPLYSGHRFHRYMRSEVETLAMANAAWAKHTPARKS